MRIIVIGAGIGGTTAALAMARLGHDVAVFDQVRENKPVGAALSLWPNGVQVLNWLGLGDEVANLGGRMDTMSYREGSTGEPMCRFSLERITLATGQRPYPVARADLQAMLLDRLGDRVHLGTRVTALEQDINHVYVTVADGTVHAADLVIAADGARSTVRDYVLGAPAAREYVGYLNINGLVPVDDAVGDPSEWTTYVADGKRVSVMPVAGDRFYFFFDVPKEEGAVPARNDIVSYLRREFAGWAPGVQRLIDRIDPSTSLNGVEIWDLSPIRQWVRGRVGLLGDAAHTTAPDIGQGACSALEDSYVLGTVFATTTLGVADSLLRYQRARVDRAADLVHRARRRSAETHAVDPVRTASWYEELRHEDGTNVIRGILGNMAGSPVLFGAGPLR